MMALVAETYPTLARIVGEDWIESGLHELMARPLNLPFFDQLEDDLRYLKRTVPEEKLIQCFRDMLRDRTQCQKAIYEIYTDAAFAYISDAPIQLHVSKTEEADSNGFDFRVRIKGCVINGEVKTRKDEALWWKGHRTPTASGVEIYSLIEDGDKKTKELSQLIEKALTQLPEKGPNIVVVGEIEGHLEDDLDEARYELFSGLPGFEQFNKLNGVIWLRLELGYRRYSKIFFNPHANESIPPEVKETLIRTFDREKYLCKELVEIKQRIIDGYDPEKIILFGSLASGNVHEWSDIDLMVIKQTSKPYFQRLKELALLTMPKVGVNFFVYTPSELEKMESGGNFFIVEEILAKGQLLYDRARGLARSGAG